ncbi:MAG TPA: Dabb family protein [Vicinamibacterales bacterium]|nr:Dabb family protein [Vicinamibacterales bacterium]
MIAHLVLFRPKGDLPAADRESLVAAIDAAHREIPAIRRFRVGKRTMRSAPYAAAMPEYSFIALIEVDDEAALQAYLDHPAHAQLARWFWSAGDGALAYDFALIDAASVSMFLEP